MLSIVCGRDVASFHSFSSALLHSFDSLEKMLLPIISKTFILYFYSSQLILGVQKSSTRSFCNFSFFFLISKNQIRQILINISTIDFYYSLPTLIRQLMDPTSKKAWSVDETKLSTIFRTST